MNSLPVFSLEEGTFLICAINGVDCTPATLRANIYCEAEYSEAPKGLLEKIASLSPTQVQELHIMLYKFWDVDYYIPSTEHRLKEIGLIKNDGELKLQNQTF
ncbi:hypothetical protein ACWATR_37155 [Nostoc sp. UIC 10890]